MKIVKRGVIPSRQKEPEKLTGVCDDCGTIIECNSDEEHLTPHYYGEPGHFTNCPVCGFILWVYLE